MAAFLQSPISRVDTLAGIDPESGAVRVLDRATFVFLILMAVSAPHSIAGTQTAWLLGMLVWFARLFFQPRVRFRFGIIDAALCGLFLWTAVTAVFSYDQPTSLDKLRSAAVFLIFYFVYHNVRTRRAAAFLGFTLIASCMVNVLWVPVERAIGRGVEIHGLTEQGPLSKALLWNGDTLLAADGMKVRDPNELLAAIGSRETTDVLFYRPDFEFTVKVNRADLLPGSTPEERLGFSTWKKSHNWRSKGFYGHYATYAEVLQLIGSLVLGLLVAGFARRKAGGGKDRLTLKLGILGGCFLLIAFALLLTVTRAPQLALMISAAVVTYFGLGRKWFLLAVVIFVPIAVGGLIFLQRSREVGFFDSRDESTRYRKVMFQDGMRIWTESPRNFIFGVGVDSIKKHWREWGMFEGGNLAVSHFHSTPVQLAVERGLPGLLLWLLLIGAYLRSLWRGLRDPLITDWRVHGILLGCLGGTVGFFASSMVHYNFGDQEVVMNFYLLMGLSVSMIHNPVSDASVNNLT